MGALIAAIDSGLAPPVLVMSYVMTCVALAFVAFSMGTKSRAVSPATLTRRS